MRTVKNTVLVGTILMIGLGGCARQQSVDYVPTSDAVVKVQNDFLDDVAEADVAARIVKACKQFEYNEAEDEVVVDRFATRAALLPTRRGVSDAEATAFQNAAPKLLQSKQSKSYIKSKVRQILAEKGVTRRNPKLICAVGEEEYAKRTQIGRFLKRS